MRATILKVWPIVPDRVACRFKSKRGGAKHWAFIVDAMAEILAEVGEDLCEQIDLPGDGDRTLGRGAVVEMSMRAYRCARARLLKEEHAAEAYRAGSFLIVEDESIRSARRAERRPIAKPVVRRKFVLDPVTGEVGYARRRS